MSSKATADVVPLSKVAAARESATLRHAIERLDVKDAQAFMNSPHDALGGNAMAVALASAEGAISVCRLIDGVEAAEPSPK